MTKQRRASKFTPRLLAIAEEWIAEHGLLEFGGAMLTDYCAALGIHHKSHYGWIKVHKEYAEMLERAKATYRRTHTKKLYNTLMEAASGYYRENSTEDVEYKPSPSNPEKPIIAKKRVHKDKKWVNPSIAAAIFLLTNLDPEHFSNHQRNDVTIHRDTEAEILPLEDIKAEIKRLSR